MLKHTLACYFAPILYYGMICYSMYSLLEIYYALVYVHALIMLEYNKLK